MSQNSQWWKTALFVLGILLIAGAVTYRLMTRSTASSSVVATPTAPVSTPASAVSNPSSAAATSSTNNSDELNWVKNLSWDNSDFIMVVFPGNNDEMGQVNQAVNSAVERIIKDNIKIKSVTLSSTDPEFRITLDRLAIQKPPAVLVWGVTGQGKVVKGDVTETKLLEAYVGLCKTCAPGSGCCGQ